MAKVLSIVILVYSFTISISYLILASLLHAEFDDRNLKPYLFGYIISFYGMFSIVTSFSAPYFIKVLGRSKMLYLGLILSSAFFGSFGPVTLIQSNTVMVIVALALRVSMGFTRSFSAITGRSLLVILEADQKIRKMGFLEAALTIGMYLVLL